MNPIYITGHRNPDMDSICAAYSYAALKNELKDGNKYRAIKCGDAKAPTRALFKKLSLHTPELMKDISPKVIDVIRRDITTLETSTPVLEAIKQLDNKNLSIIPVFNEEQEFSGVVSLHEISSFLISENLGKRPVYNFRTPNFQKVLPGYFYLRGKDINITASIMTGARPYEASLKKLKELETSKPVLVIGMRKDLIDFAIDVQLPAIIITGMEKDATMDVDFSDFKGTVYVSHTDTAETIRLLRLSAPVKQIMQDAPITVESTADFDVAKKLLLGSTDRGLPVMTNGEFTGIVTRRCFIEKPRKKIILVDHNELDQSIPGAEQAQVVEILDHHRIDTAKTREPIYIYARPVGSTCTIVYLHYQMAGIEPTPEVAALLLGGLISDTLDLRSPTTTDEDRRVAKELEELSTLTKEETATLIFSHSSSLKNGNPREILLADFKTYQERGLSVGIGQVEVITLEEVDLVKEEFLAVLEEVKTEKRLDWVLLLVTDVIKQDSVLFSTGFKVAEKKLIFNQKEPHIFDLPKIMSRKKQLFPEVYRVLEEVDAQANE